MSSFTEVEAAWVTRLGNLRNIVRQHLVRQQLAEHLGGVTSVLDVGCGQGTQAIELAAAGLHVTGVDPSPDLLRRLDADAAARGCAVVARQGTIEDLERLCPASDFDLVCAHGLLMYLPDARQGVWRLRERVRPGGLMSFTVRNGDALAFRPGIRHQWGEALEAFDADTYVNQLGADAHAHRLEEVLGWCRELDLVVQAWYGVRVFTDGVGPDAIPDHATLAQCLLAEEEAGRRDPYRRLASQLHVIARAGGRGDGTG